MFKFIKNTVIVLIFFLVFSISLGLGILIFNNEKKPNDEMVVKKHENNYTLYINTKYLIKFDFVEITHTCIYNNEENSCGKLEDKITSFTLLNDKSKKAFKNAYFQEMNLNDAINQVIEKNPKRINITTNWDNETEQSLLEDLIMTNNPNTKINIDIKDEINEQVLINKDLKSDKSIKTYTVKFNSNGGSKVTEIVVKSNKKVKKPTPPTRKGYTFVEWQYKDKKYDFNKPIKKNITLKAKWKKNKKSS